jgi:hypothetical protein
MAAVEFIKVEKKKWDDLRYGRVDNARNLINAWKSLFSCGERCPRRGEHDSSLEYCSPRFTSQVRPSVSELVHDVASIVYQALTEGRNWPTLPRGWGGLLNHARHVIRNASDPRFSS